MSYPSLEESIGRVKNNSHYILLLALLLGDPEIREKKTWNVLAKSFFKNYREMILLYCGYDIGPANLERIRVMEPKLFIEYMSGMFRNGMVLFSEKMEKSCIYKFLIKRNTSYYIKEEPLPVG